MLAVQDLWRSSDPNLLLKAELSPSLDCINHGFAKS